MSKKRLLATFLSIGILAVAFAPGASAFWPFDGWFSNKEGEVLGTYTPPKKPDYSNSIFRQLKSRRTGSGVTSPAETSPNVEDGLPSSSEAYSEEATYSEENLSKMVSSRSLTQEQASKIRELVRKIVSARAELKSYVQSIKGYGYGKYIVNPEKEPTKYRGEYR